MGARSVLLTTLAVSSIFVAGSSASCGGGSGGSPDCRRLRSQPLQARLIPLLHALFALEQPVLCLQRPLLCALGP